MIVKVVTDFSLSEDNLSKLRKAINLHYLGDENCNTNVNGQYVPKYPEKETRSLRDAHYNISRSFEIELDCEFDFNGNLTSINGKKF